jgi:hypothetical protein
MLCRQYWAAIIGTTHTGCSRVIGFGSGEATVRTSDLSQRIWLVSSGFLGSVALRGRNLKVAAIDRLA